MISHAEDLRDHTHAESLRVLLRHFQSELVQLQTSEGAGGPSSIQGGGPAGA